MEAPNIGMFRSEITLFLPGDVRNVLECKIERVSTLCCLRKLQPPFLYNGYVLGKILKLSLKGGGRDSWFSLPTNGPPNSTWVPQLSTSIFQCVFSHIHPALKFPAHQKLCYHQIWGWRKRSEMIPRILTPSPGPQSPGFSGNSCKEQRLGVWAPCRAFLSSYNWQRDQ